MSDENAQVPSLRLKPRIRPEALGTPVPPPVQATPVPDPLPPEPLSAENFPPPAPSDQAAPPPTPRLRPRILSADPVPAPSEPAPPPMMEAPAASAPPFPPPVLPPPPSAPIATETVEVGRFKLKPRLSAADAPTPTLPLPSLPPTAVSGAPQGMKVVATPPAANLSAPKPTPFIRSATPPPAAAVGEKKSSALSRSFKRSLIILGVVAGLGISIGGFLVLRMMTKLEKKSVEAPIAIKPVKAHPPAAHPEEAATPEKKGPVVEHPESLPGKMVGKARDTIAAREAGEQVRGVNDIMDSGAAHTASHAPAGAAAAQSESAEENGNELDNIAPKVAPKTEAPAPRPAPMPSAAFRAEIVNLRVNGVFQGEPGRALLNGRMVQAGEIFDSSMGIRLAGIDANHKLLIFQDTSGAIMERRY